MELNQPITCTIKPEYRNDCLINFEGRAVWVPYSKAAELNKMLTHLTKAFWGTYLQELEKKDDVTLHHTDADVT